MWKLTIEDDEGKKTPLSLARDQYTIGRGEENTIRLTERNISRRHALLRRESNGWVFVDMNSSNGCQVNGVRLAREHAIAHGDVIQLGDYRIEFVNEEKAAIQPAVGEGFNPLAHDRLVVVVGPAPGQEFPLTADRVIVGRAEDADIVLSHGSVSRVHAEIHALGSGRYEIIDQGSFNGVRVNGSQLQRGLLEAGDFIELGDVRVRFVGKGQYYKPGPEAERLEDDGFGLGPPSAPNPVGTPLPPLAAPSGPPAAPAAPPLIAAAEDPTAASVRPARRTNMVWIGTGVIALALGVGLVTAKAMRRGPPRDAAMAVQASPAPDSALTILNDAMRLAGAGSLDAAHARLSAIPAESSVRDLRDFKNLETAWADSTLARAANETDNNVRREWLKSVAQATTVDAERRKRAADAILALDEGTGTNINELPADKKPTREREREGGRAAAPAAAAPAADHPVLAANPFDEPSPAPARAAEPAGRSAAASAAAPGGAAGGSGQTTRATDLALSGRDGEVRARAELEPRVWSGQATVEEIKMLRAICRHMGDRACIDRASALLTESK